jgi:surfactin synthase thioesterase subunit
MRAEPLDAPITALGGQSDVSVPEDYLDAWRSETAAAFKKQLFPGGHFYLQNAMPLVSARIMEELTNLMRSEMAAA